VRLGKLRTDVKEMAESRRRRGKECNIIRIAHCPNKVLIPETANPRILQVC